MAAHKGQAEAGVGTIIEVVLMIVIALTAFYIISNFAEATPELKALGDARTAIESVCALNGPNYHDAPIVMPEGYRLELKKIGGTLELKKDSDLISKKKLECPVNIIFSDCTVGPTTQGHEGITLGVNKTVINPTTKQTEITLNATGTTYDCT
jgi:hypothetical protein